MWVCGQGATVTTVRTTYPSGSRITFCLIFFNLIYIIRHTPIWDKQDTQPLLCD
ncbi:hypothetical protein M011DRAFT_423553 [Sporormia fimetaria CBS 119925]|uniref:Uncharacterized protein n=1 Tax=Sporormia fimetaria CBS 119925 TaxID=1340428 RepID=A0A6A6VDG4_9PLEO|nr:hypothetical protein M011DRAFT_423553 [Sporormia fimetaria CBS 119925]